MQSLDAEATKALLQAVPQAYNTRINDVLVAALALAFRQWTGASTLLLEMEGHGREALFEDVDLSRTLGWFTSLYPVLIDLGDLVDSGASLKSVKEQLRAIPDQGVGFGLLRYLGRPEQRGALGALPRGEILFNYLGQFDQILDTRSVFTGAREQRGAEVSPRNRLRHSLSINAQIAGERLSLAWTYSTSCHRSESIAAFADSYLDHLNALISHCLSAGAGGETPSAFPETDFSQDELDEFMADFGDVGRN